MLLLYLHRYEVDLLVICGSPLCMVVHTPSLFFLILNKLDVRTTIQNGKLISNNSRLVKGNGFGTSRFDSCRKFCLVNGLVHEAWFTMSCVRIAPPAHTPTRLPLLLLIVHPHTLGGVLNARRRPSDRIVATRAIGRGRSLARFAANRVILGIVAACRRKVQDQFGRCQRGPNVSCHDPT